MSLPSESHDDQQERLNLKAGCWKSFRTRI